MRVLSFDPGYERLGVAVLEKEKGKEKLLYSDCLRTSAKQTFAERLAHLGTEIEKLIAKHKPSCVAIENLYFENNAKTAMNVSAVRGMLIYLAATHGLAVYEYTPLQVKAAVTGHGKSDKKAVGLMVQRILGLSVGTTSATLRAGKLDDEVDAIAVGITCLASLR